MTTNLDLLTCRRTPPVILQLLFDESHTETEGQKHGPVSRGAAGESPPEAGGLKLGCQALQRGAVIAVPGRQESLRLNGADRRAYTETISSEPCCDSATGFEETQLKDRPAQLEPPANGVFHRHNLPRKGNLSCFWGPANGSHTSTISNREGHCCINKTTATEHARECQSTYTYSLHTFSTQQHIL